MKEVILSVMERLSIQEKINDKVQIQMENKIEIFSICFKGQAEKFPWNEFAGDEATETAAESAEWTVSGEVAPHQQGQRHQVSGAASTFIDYSVSFIYIFGKSKLDKLTTLFIVKGSFQQYWL